MRRVRPYSELVSDESAWPAIAGLFANARSPIRMLPSDLHAARTCLESLQVSTRSTLGSIAYQTGGVLIDYGWIRLLGSGHPALTRRLGQWNAQLRIPLASFVLVGDDAVGGIFALDGGGLNARRGNVCYFVPTSLDWHDMMFGYTGFLQWLTSVDLDAWYRDLRWPSWRDDVSALPGDHSFALFPPPSTWEGKDVSTATRRAVPAAGLWRLHLDVRSRRTPTPDLDNPVTPDR